MMSKSNCMDQTVNTNIPIRGSTTIFANKRLDDGSVLTISSLCKITSNWFSLLKKHQ